MKAKIIQRSVYHKIAEVEIDIPDNIDEYDIQQYINDNENLWVDKVDHKINEAEFVKGNGMDDKRNWVDDEEDEEWRYECETETFKTGGHL